MASVVAVTLSAPAISKSSGRKPAVTRRERNIDAWMRLTLPGAAAGRISIAAMASASAP